MKKSIISFIVFLLVFFAALGLIHSERNPSTRMPDVQADLEWHGRVENEYGTYNGALIGDLFEGKGRFSFLSGETYTGDWDDSYMEGTGITVFPGVGEYSGEMRDSKRNGKGTFKWYSGDVYEGIWKDDEMSGTGRYTFSDGSLFEGEFENNRPVSGKYRFNIVLGEETTDSDIISLEYSVSGKEETIVFSTAGGLKYDGDLSGLTGTGNAKIIYPSGNQYEGAVAEGKRDGSGKYVWKDSAGKTIAYYEGSWSSDHMNGQGKYHYTDAAYPYLTGVFIDDTPSGTMTYYKEAGNTFETKWENGVCVSVKET